MEQRINTLIVCGAIVLLFYIVAVLLIFADLWAGVRKARQRGEMRTSEAYKRTVEKINKYFNMHFAMSLVDAVQIGLLYFLYHEYGYDIPFLPFFSFISVSYEAFVEIKSIMEPANVKEAKQQEDFKRLLMQLAENKDMKEKLVGLLKAGGDGKTIARKTEKGGEI